MQFFNKTSGHVRNIVMAKLLHINEDNTYTYFH